MWTQFMDMHSGGGSKTSWQYIFIEAANRDDAEVFFFNKFGLRPDHVTCRCCGSDFAVHEAETLEQATGFERGCRYQDKGYVEEPDVTPWRKYISLDEYKKRKDILIIYASEITPKDLEGELPDYEDFDDEDEDEDY